MTTPNQFELKLHFGENRLAKIFARHDHKSTDEKAEKLAAYAAETRGRKEWLDSLKQKTLIDRKDYFSQVKDAFEKLSSSLITLRAGVAKKRDSYELEGLARKHHAALLNLIELHKGVISATVSRGIHTEKNIDETLRRIKEQIDNANELFRSRLSRLFSK